MFPIGEEYSGSRSIAVVVFLLLLVNIFVFLVELTGGESFIAAYAAVPYEISHGVDLTRPVIVPGLGVIPQAPGPAPIYLTLFTSMFMHAGLLHLAGNMLYLWIFGRHIEDNFGHLKIGNAKLSGQVLITMNEVPQEGVFRRPQLFIGTIENDFAALDHDEFRIDQAE
jgi:membrane associated rhomboid family serine protease